MAWTPVDPAAPGVMWERVDASHPHWLFRAKVPGGWLVTGGIDPSRPAPRKLAEVVGVGLTFVPDPQHEWELPQPSPLRA